VLTRSIKRYPDGRRRRHPRVALQLSPLVQAFGREDQLVVEGHAASDESSVASLRDDGDPLLDRSKGILTADAGAILESLSNFLHPKGYMMPLDLGAPAPPPPGMLMLRTVPFSSGKTASIPSTVPCRLPYRNRSKGILTADAGAILESLSNFLHPKGYMMPLDLGATAC
jgi:FAD/FMN-containing dehydrogenase